MRIAKRLKDRTFKNRAQMNYLASPVIEGHSEPMMSQDFCFQDA